MNFDAPHHCYSPLEGGHTRLSLAGLTESHCVNNYMLTYVALSIYTLKNMTNSNIPSGRGLILSGDRQKAGTFLRIAQLRMAQMKQMMRVGNLQYMRRVHHLERDCVWVHLTSISGNDFIRIHSCAEDEDCSLDFTATPLAINAFDDAVFTVNVKGDITHTQVLPGNGEVDSSVVTYKDAGVYSPTVRAWEISGVQQTSFVPTLVSYYKDTGWYKSFGAAQGAFSSASWVAVTSNSQINPGFQFKDGESGTRFAPTMTQYMAHYSVSNSIEYWRVKAVKEVFTVPYSTIVSEADHFSTLNVRLGNLDVVRGNGVDSGPAVQLDGLELGHHIYHGATTHATGTGQFTVDTTPASIDRVDRELEIVDMNNYAQLSNPKIVDFLASGWHLEFEVALLSKANQRRTTVYPIKSCKKIKTRADYITVI